MFRSRLTLNRRYVRLNSMRTARRQDALDSVRGRDSLGLATDCGSQESNGDYPGPVFMISTEPQAPGVARTSFRRFRRTIFEGTCFLRARRICLGAFSRASGDTKALQLVSGRGEMLDALLRTHHNGLTCKSRQSSTDLTHHEKEQDRDAQDRAGRPSAVATRRPAQTTSRPERPEDRAARRNEL